MSSSRPGMIRNSSHVKRDSRLQDSETKSLVRVALKNQRREQKVTGNSTGYQSMSHRGGQHNDVSSSNRPSYNRNRVNSGVPFLRGSGGHIAGNRPSSSQNTIDMKNKARNSSVCSNASNNSTTKNRFRSSNIKPVLT